MNKSNSMVLVLFFILIGCKNSGTKENNILQEKIVLNEGFKKIIDEYIVLNQLKSSRLIGKSSIESGFSYPSYHLFFNKKKTDTIFSIVLFPNYNNFELEETSVDNETSYSSIKHKGWLMYKDKYPLIIFDNNNFSNKFIKSDKLIYKIPDSLRAGYNNQHIKFIKLDYKINNNNFERMDLLYNTHTHP